MKNTLTTEQKINEFIGKLVGNLLTKRASKVLAKTMQNDTQLKKHIDNIEKNTDYLKRIGSNAFKSKIRKSYP